MKVKIFLLFALLALIFAPIYVSATPQEANNNGTSLSLEPSLIQVPCLKLDQGAVILSVNLTFRDISNMKKFTVILTFDGKVLEYYTSHAGDWGYSGSRSTNPRYGVVTMSGELTDGREISGSGTFFTFAFKVLSVGTSQILLQYIYLEDKFGSEIPYTISRSNVTVEVLPLDVWVDGKYAELKQEYEGLLENYTNLEAEYRTLNSTHHSLLAEYYSLNSTFHILLSNYTDLQGNYKVLSSDYKGLLEDLNSLNSSYNKLQADYESMNLTYSSYVATHSYTNLEYETLKANYETLNSSYKTLQSNHNSLTDNYAVANSLNYILTITTAVFIATTVYFVKRKPKIP